MRESLASIRRKSRSLNHFNARGRCIEHLARTKAVAMSMTRRLTTLTGTLMLVCIISHSKWRSPSTHRLFGGFLRSFYRRPWYNQAEDQFETPLTRKKHIHQHVKPLIFFISYESTDGRTVRWNSPIHGWFHTWFRKGRAFGIYRLGTTEWFWHRAARRIINHNSSTDTYDILYFILKRVNS